MRRTALAVLVMAGLMPAVGVARDGIVIGGKIFTESYVLGEMAAQTIEADSARAGDPQARHGQHGHLVRGAEERRHRCVPGLHRHLGRGHPEKTGVEVAGGHPRVAVGDGPHHLGLARVQRHLCAGGERRVRGKAQPAFDRRPDSHRVAGAGRIQLRVHGPQGRLPRLDRQLPPGVEAAERQAAWSIP